MSRLLIHEGIAGDGSSELTFLEYGAGKLSLTLGGETLACSHELVEGVMRRYGKPLEQAAPPAVASIDLGEGRVLAHFRHLARYDVIARDFLLYSTPNSEPVCELATLVTSALAHLCRVVASKSSA